MLSVVDNLLGEGAAPHLPGGPAAMAEVAAWAARHDRDLAATLQAISSHPGQQRWADLPFREELRKYAWVTPGAAPKLTRAGVGVMAALQRHLSTDRTAETRRFVHHSATIDASSRVLDIGCSTGNFLFSLADRGARRMVGLDADLFALHLAALRSRELGLDARWCCANALPLPFPDGAFTHVMSLITLNELPMRTALREMARVLEVGGQLILTVEGPGFWVEQMRNSRARRRLHLLTRELLGNLALPIYDWQRHPALWRVARHAVISVRGITRLLTETGYEVERSEVLLHEHRLPRLIGVTARRRPPR